MCTGIDYDLVRIHHPDSPIVRSLSLSPEVAHARFQSISAAYDSLRGKAAQDPMSKASRQYGNDSRMAAWRAAQSRRPDLHVAPDERWKDMIIIGGVVLVCNPFFSC